MLEHLRRLIVHLYPRPWRDRYGDEFSALLDDSPARWRDLPDLAQGALTTQLQMQSWKPVAIAGLIGLLAAATLSFLQPPQFASVAKIRTTSASTVPYLSMYVLSRSALAEVIQKFGLYPNDLARLPLEDIVEEMRHDIHIETDPGNASEFVVQFRYPDAQKAQAVVRALVAGYVFENERESMKGTLQHSTVEQLTPPDLSSHPLRGLPLSILLWGLSLGILAGLIVRQPFRRTLRLAAFALAGLIAVAAPMYLVNSRYLSTATIVAKRAITAPPPQTDVQLQEIPMPPDSPHVYRVSAIRIGPLPAQRAVQQVLVALDPAIREIVEPATHPALPISPNRLFAALCGATAALMYGIYRTRPHRSPERVSQ